MYSAIDNIHFHFLYIDRYSFGRNWIFPESSIPYNMLRYIESGTASFFIDSQEYSVKKDQIIYIPKGSQLSCFATSSHFSFTSIRFTSSVFFEGGDLLGDYYHLPKIMEGKGESFYFDEIYQWVKKESPAKMFFVRGYLELLIASLIAKVNPERDQEEFPSISLNTKNDIEEQAKNSANLSSQSQPSSCSNKEATEEQDLEKIRNQIKKSGTGMDSRIQGVVDYILLHPNEKYSPSRLAEMAELSKQRFTSLFSSQLGKSPMVYVKELKLTTAARKLLVSNLHINDIAYELGYEDTNYFIREFKRAFGCTPNQYRHIAKE
ncbi:helix-turn-helix domain-containing protein [Oribacterium sinus]|uniref:helix-turn-helix domain-containing protein n=1 Tax=Oribacterium sinus TaxID=237576 RepID=UPI0028E6D382|nr:helix-turn-helix domain-containing protein [Oribacterium sinus]